MKAIICLFVLITCALAGLIKHSPNHSPKNFKRFIYIADEEGEIELIDLHGKPSDTIKVESSDIKIYLYTQQNPDEPYEILNCDVSKLDGSTFDPTKISLFVTHGWHNNYESSVNTKIRTAALKKYDINIFVVDWSSKAGGLYLTAYGSVIEVGQFLGQFINEIQAKYGLTGSQFVLAGHSLGAHVSGNAGAVINSKISVIIGLDPAEPLFSESNTDNRLDPSDATFVHVIHTNGLLLGFATPIGHADYFPNGGKIQPGCGLDITGSCSHSRAYLYYAESLEKGTVFSSFQCDDYDTYSDGKCSNNAESPLGLLDVDTSASGEYFLNTNEESPFGQG